MSDAAEEAPAEGADGHGEKPKKKGGGTSPIVMALLVLNLGASGFGAFKIMTAKPAAAATATEEHHEEKSSKEITGPVVALDPFVVNLDEPGNARYLKMTAQLELVNAKDTEIIEKSKQVVRDEILSYLSGLHVKDTLGAEAKDHIREALLKKLEGAIGEHHVRRIFFQEFMVQ
ncbi:MAG: flagellar basal body-associated FliL family protein [Kofleriaceae bacterium]